MARIRTIKPDFFTSEDICALTPRARLLYIALWCEADREGRLVWKPATFKLRYFPADKVDIGALCLELTGRGLVVLYGEGHAHVPTFLEHQHINPREAVSSLPVPDATRADACPTRADASNLDMHAQGGREGKGRERKGKEGDVDACASSAVALSASGALNGNAVACIPLNDGSEFGVSKEYAEELARLFPAVDVPQTLNEIRGWNLANPSRKKTRRGVLSHINGWMSKEQNRGPKA